MPYLNPTDQERLQKKLIEISEKIQLMSGYPCNHDYDYSDLYPFLQYSINNLGDPWQSSNYNANTFEFEQEVISQFAQWMHAPEDNYWGYVTTGGTEGNLYALYLARELYPNGIVYYSEATHYSVTKIIHVLGMKSIMIRAQDNGEIDYTDLRETLRLNRDKTPIIFANIGTTMTQAVDNLPEIQSMLREFAISDYYLHSDAAFSGAYYPFLDTSPPFDFGAGTHSISVSGHKFIGSPIPCGIVLALKHNVARIGRRIEYVGAMDTTILGSRNAFTPLVLWYGIKRHGETGLRQLAQHCQEMAIYCEEKLKSIGVQAWRNPHGLTVIFPRPSGHIIRKWCLAPDKDIAHIITTGEFTKTHIDALVDDIAKDKEQAA
jgi:histidine decarboxylase